MTKTSETESYTYQTTLADEVKNTSGTLHQVWDAIDFLKKFPDTKHYPVDFDELNLGQYIVERTKKAVIDHKIGIFFTWACLDEVIGFHTLSKVIDAVGLDAPTGLALYMGIGAATSLITDKIANYFLDLHFQNKTLKQDVKKKADYVWNREYRKK